MSNSTVGNTIDNNVGDLETALCDIFGFTIDTDVTASPFTLDNAGRITKALVAQRAVGPVGWRLRDTTANKEVRLVVNGTNFDVDENTGSEAVPVWTNRFRMAVADGALTGAVATASRMGLCPQGDGNTAHFLDGTLAWSTPTTAVIPLCRLRNTANQTLASGSFADITFNTEDVDTDTMHSTVSNTNRITCVTAGKYYVLGAVSFTSNPTGVRLVQIQKNGGTIYGASAHDAVAASGNIVQVSAVVDMVAGDYVTLAAYQNSGSSLNSVAAAVYSPTFAAYRVG